MQCNKARRRLDDCSWSFEKYSHDRELIEHLKECENCRHLVQVEESLSRDLGMLRKAEPTADFSLDSLREYVTRVEHQKRSSDKSHGVLTKLAMGILGPGTGRKIAIACVMVIVAVAATIPFNYREKVGYKIAIAGIEKNIAMNNQKVSALLDALGMEETEASTLLDSLGANQINFSVGECTETCRLTISDLKTERDVTLMVRAIIELGCCLIDDIAPIFRDESSSLLGFAFRKLMS